MTGLRRPAPGPPHSAAKPFLFPASLVRLERLEPLGRGWARRRSILGDRPQKTRTFPGDVAAKGSALVPLPPRLSTSQGGSRASRASRANGCAVRSIYNRWKASRLAVGRRDPQFRRRRSGCVIGTSRNCTRHRGLPVGARSPPAQPYFVQTAYGVPSLAFPVSGVAGNLNPKILSGRRLQPDGVTRRLRSTPTQTAPYISRLQGLRALRAPPRWAAGPGLARPGRSGQHGATHPEQCGLPEGLPHPLSAVGAKGIFRVPRDSAFPRNFSIPDPAMGGLGRGIERNNSAN